MSENQPVKLQLKTPETNAAPAAPDSGAASPQSVTLKMPTLKMPSAAPAATSDAAPAGGAAKTVALKMPTLKVAESAGQTVATPAPAAPADGTSSPLKIRMPGEAPKPAVADEASATIKITPQAAASAAPAAPAGDSAIKQTGRKLTLKHTEEKPESTVAVPVPPMAQAPAAPAGEAPAPQTAETEAPHGGLKLKKAADETVVAEAPAPETNSSSTDTATGTGTAGTGTIRRLATKGDKASGTAAAPNFVPMGSDSESSQLGAVQGICSIVSFLALGAACYFIVMDFLKYI